MSRPVDVDPVVTIDDSPGRKGARVENHPAYAMISAARASGRGARLFGTDFSHNHFVTLRIAPASVTRDLNHDWFHGSLNSYIEVTLSEAQWVGMISRMNTEGVPCTLSALNGKMVPGIGDGRESKETRLRREVDDRMQAAVEAVAALTEKVASSTLKVADRKRINDALHQLRMAVGSSIAFTAQSMQEEITDSIDKAKIEVEAYLTHAVAAAGFAVLRGAPPAVALEAARGVVPDKES